MLAKNLPADSPLYGALREAEAKAEAKAKVQSIDDALSMFGR